MGGLSTVLVANFTKAKKHNCLFLIFLVGRLKMPDFCKLIVVFTIYSLRGVKIGSTDRSVHECTWVRIYMAQTAIQYVHITEMVGVFAAKKKLNDSKRLHAVP
jgi:hypothetical protein